MHRLLSSILAIVLSALPAAGAFAQAQSAAKTLDMYFIDTEGGQSTLFMSPCGSPRSHARRSMRPSMWHEAHDACPRPEVSCVP